MGTVADRPRIDGGLVAPPARGPATAQRPSKVGIPARRLGRSRWLLTGCIGRRRFGRTNGRVNLHGRGMHSAVQWRQPATPHGGNGADPGTNRHGSLGFCRGANPHDLGIFARPKRPGQRPAPRPG